MKRYVKNKDRQTPTPVNQVEVSNKHVKLRTILFILFVVLATVFFAIALVLLLKVEPGWYSLKVDSSEYNNGDEFDFYYYFGDNDDKDYRQSVQKKYTEANVYAYNIFCDLYQIDDTKNLYYLNTHPNQEIQVPGLLYRSLKTFEDSGNRFLYYAPVRQVYNTLLTADNDDIASSCDITQNNELRAYVEKLISYIENEENVKLEFYPNNTIKLFVSDSYLNEFKDEGLVYIDFSWTKNAFIIDYIADSMTSAGYVNGVISSKDGFTRNLSKRDETYTSILYDFVCEDSGANYAMGIGEIKYYQKLSFVSLRNYPISSGEDGYYVYEDGTIRTLFVDFSSGENISAVNGLTAYSELMNCVDMVINLIPIYLNDELDMSKLDLLSNNGLFILYCEDSTIKTNGNLVELIPLDRGDLTYEVENIK